MSEPTYPGDSPTGGSWSQVYTGLDWVARWMADRGYTDAEIGYVVGEEAALRAAVRPTFEPVFEPVFEPTFQPVEVTPAPVVVEAEQTTWIVPLAAVDGDAAEQGEDVPADQVDAETTEDSEFPEAYTA